VRGHWVGGSALRSLWAVLAACAAASAAHADALSAVQVLRMGGCGGVVPAAQPLRHNAWLDRTAAQWASGGSLPTAAMSNGFRAEFTTGVYVRAQDSSLLEELRRSSCSTLSNRGLREIGAYRNGLDTWLVVVSVYPITAPAAPAANAPLLAAPGVATASPALPPPAAAPSTRPDTAMAAQPPVLANRALQLVNEVRARGARCGQHSLGPAPPLTLSGTLADVAFGHAVDMADQNYFAHEDLAGHSPADRVRAIGYPEKLVGENIAYGPRTIEEVVQGWLDSPGHCENIMDPRFAEMGIANATGRATRHGLYWVQVLAAPRS
jgi:uncharacterized protein YkwD